MTSYSPCSSINNSIRDRVDVYSASKQHRATSAVPTLCLSNEFLARTVGDGARLAREPLGLTRPQAAENLRVSARHLGRIEDGRALPSLPLFVRMADEYGVSADELLGWRAATSFDERSHDLVDSAQLPDAVGKAVRQAREALDMCQLWLAARIGITVRHLSRIEGGTSLPSLPVLARLVDELDLTADALLVRDERLS